MENPIPEVDSLSLYNFLEGCTSSQLRSFELSRLSRASDLQRELNGIAAKLIRVSAEALLARTLFESRKTQSLDETTSIAKELLADLIPAQVPTETGKPLKPGRKGNHDATTKKS